MAPFDLDSLSLESESEESLLLVGKKNIRHWILHLATHFAFGFFLLAVSVYLLLSGYRCRAVHYEFVNHGFWHAFNNTRGGTLDFALCLFACGGGLLGIIYIIFTSIRLFAGTPKSGKTYHDTINAYIGNILSTDNKLLLNSYVCLLQSSRDTIGDNYNNYRQYCDYILESIKATILNALSINNDGQFFISSSNIDIAVASHVKNIILATISIEIKSFLQSGKDGKAYRKELPEFYLYFSLPVANIGEYWYIASLEWKALIAKTREANENETQELMICPSDIVQTKENIDKCGKSPSIVTKSIQGSDKKSNDGDMPVSFGSNNKRKKVVVNDIGEKVRQGPLDGNWHLVGMLTGFIASFKLSTLGNGYLEAFLIGGGMVLLGGLLGLVINKITD
ncbi:MAG: hypothetical protein P9M14_03030 [Candidatus Alcyoniella australis]|nr:hypothetical protein [Candidatus Alcyoniella australis]